MFRSIRTTLLFWYGLIFLLLLAAFGTTVYLRISRTIFRSVDAKLETYAQGLAAGLVEMDDGSVDLDAPKSLRNLFRRGDDLPYYLVWDRGGKVIHRSPAAKDVQMPAEEFRRSRGSSREVALRGPVNTWILVGGKARPVFGRLTAANEGTKATAITAFEEAGLESANDVFTALEMALDIAGKKDSVAWDSGPEEILYVDVALPWRAEHTDPLLIGPAIALKARARMVPITMVGIGDHPYELCQMLANTTGGTYASFAAEVPTPPPANPTPGR